MLPKCDMTRDEEAFIDGIITTIAFMFDTKTEKTTKGKNRVLIYCIHDVEEEQNRHNQRL